MESIIENIKKYRGWIIAACFIVCIAGYFMWRGDYGAGSNSYYYNDRVDELRQNARQLSKVQKQETEKWNLLSASQKRQAETLNQQREEIENSQKEMAETRQSLERANSLLKKANESLENQKKSYQKLTEETESVLQRKNHEIVVAKRQRDTWAIGAGLIGIFGIFLAVSD